MAFSLAPPVQALTAPFSTLSSRTENKFIFQKVCASHQNSGYEDENRSVPRRNVTLGLGLAGAALSLSINEQSAKAAGRRAPPPPPEEKKDLSMSALQAKVMASKKRREAMKEEMARLRERGKPITSPSE